MYLCSCMCAPCIICTMYEHVYILHIANTGTTHLHLHIMYNGICCINIYIYTLFPYFSYIFYEFYSLWTFVVHIICKGLW